MPVSVGNLPVSTQTTGTFDFDLDGAICGQTMNFDISVTADEMTGSNLDAFTHGPVEQDLALTASRTDDFETGNDGWTFVQGYARENVTAASGVWSVHSSSGLDDQNDAALSPVFRKGAGATQVVIAERHDIEAPFWDRANVHAIRLERRQPHPADADRPDLHRRRPLEPGRPRRHRSLAGPAPTSPGATRPSI